MKRLIFTLLTVATALCATAQDVIFKSESDTIVAKVISVGTSEITYQKWSNLQGPIYSMSISQIVAIRYANGTYDFFTTKPTPVVVNSNTIPSLTRSGNTYIYGDLFMNKNDYENWLKEQNCQAAYKQFLSGRRLAGGGWFMMALGIGLDLGSIIVAATNRTNNIPAAAIAFGVIGGGLEIACIPTLIVGYSKMHRSVDIYNASCKTTAQAKPYWAIQASNNGLGIAYKF